MPRLGQGPKVRGGYFLLPGLEKNTRWDCDEGPGLLESVSSLRSCKLIRSECSCTPVRPFADIWPTVQLQPRLLLHPLPLCQAVASGTRQTLTPSPSGRTASLRTGDPDMRTCNEVHCRNIQGVACHIAHEWCSALNDWELVGSALVAKKKKNPNNPWLIISHANSSSMQTTQPTHCLPQWSD